MAFPVILIDTATGTDGLCSGAGPATALNGVNNASTDAAGTTVTLPASTDLTNVATDGSHAIYLGDTTAGHRRYAKITSKAGSGGPTPTVGVAEAYTINLVNKTWAIGGKLATLFQSSSSVVLLENNSANGDAMPGWIMELANSHTESPSSAIVWRRAGDTTSGPIIVRGAAGATTVPIITYNQNSTFLSTGGNNPSGHIIQNIEFQNSNATKTASTCLNLQGGDVQVIGVKIDHSTNKWWKAIVSGSAGSCIRDSSIGYCANIGIDLTDGQGHRVLNNYVHDCGATAGINSTADNLGTIIYGNICYNNTGDGIRAFLTTTSYNRQFFCAQNTCASNTSDGIEITTAVQTPFAILNNILANNGAYGLNFSGAADAGLTCDGSPVVGNQTFNNTSGAYKSTTAGYAYNACPWASGDLNLNPTFTSATTGNFAIGPNLESKAYPVGGTVKVGSFSASDSYMDPGAVQRQLSGATGYLLVAN